jgi:hypothetical protein
MSTDLAAWLLEQITEDEQVARETNDQMMPRYDWEVRETHPEKLPSVFAAGEIYFVVHEVYDEAAHHIARWDPARVLSECDAKRRLIELHSRDGGSGYCRLCESTDPTETDGSHWVLYPCRTLRSLALPYADRPGYREDWRL